MNKIVFTDSLHGWLLGETHIFRSADGGATWPVVDTFPVRINDICILSNYQGYAAGNGGFLYRFSEPVTTGITNTSQENLFTLSPNPTSDFLEISLHKPFTGEIQLEDITGKRIVSRGVLGEVKPIINLRALSPGVYILTLRSEEGMISKKVIKQ